MYTGKVSTTYSTHIAADVQKSVPRIEWWEREQSQTLVKIERRKKTQRFRVVEIPFLKNLLPMAGDTEMRPYDTSGFYSSFPKLIFFL